MNYDILNGQPIRITWSQRDPSLRISGVGNVFIKNLKKSIDSKAMYDKFSIYGKILSCKVATDEVGVSKGYGFVHFETEKAANDAIARVNGELFSGQKVFVGKFIAYKERKKMLEGKGETFCNLYTKNFGKDLDDKKLRELFEKYGKITSAKAIEELNGTELNGKLLYVGKAQKKSERHAELRQRFGQRTRHHQGANLFVKNLDDAIDDERLREEFSSFGTITSAKVMTDSSQRSKGFGFVCFSSPEEATRAARDMNGHTVVSKPLYVSLAQRKEERRAHLASQFMQRMASMQKQQHGQMFPQPNRGYFSAQMSPVQATAISQQANTCRTSPLQAVVASQNVAMHKRMNARPIGHQPAGAPTGMVSGGSMATVGAALPTILAASVNQGHPSASNMRNPPQASVQQAVYIQGQEPLTTLMLAEANAQEQKRMLGERLFLLIFRWYPELAGKITGVLLQTDNSELLHMLEHHEALKDKVDKVSAVLQSYAMEMSSVGI